MARNAFYGTSTSDIARLLMMQGTQVPDAGLGPVTNTTRAGRPNPMLTAPPNQERPADYMQPVAELLSLPMGAYGAGQLVGSGINAAREGDYASGAGQVALGMAGMLPMAPKGGKGIRAFHGSPHDFDKFSMEHIGKGEGAQAYGHGLYFAEAEDVARSYRENLTRGARTGSGPGRIDVFTVDGAEVPASQKSVADIAHTMREYSIDPNTADGLDWLQREVGARGLPFETIEQAANLYKRDITRNTVDGRMYEVNIKADPQDFLDWDKPLSQQSENVRNAVLGSGLAKTPFGSIDTVKHLLAKERGRLAETQQEIASNRGMFGSSKMSKDERAYYERIADEAMARIDEFERILSGDATASYLIPQHGDTAAQFSSAMREAGIPGIRYLDQMSRGEGKGSSNYVVFDDNLIEILRKYGLLPPVAAGGLAAALGQEDELY